MLVLSARCMHSYSHRFVVIGFASRQPRASTDLLLPRIKATSCKHSLTAANIVPQGCAACDSTIHIHVDLSTPEVAQQHIPQQCPAYHHVGSATVTVLLGLSCFAYCGTTQVHNPPTAAPVVLVRHCPQLQGCGSGGDPGELAHVKRPHSWPSCCCCFCGCIGYLPLMKSLQQSLS